MSILVTAIIFIGMFALLVFVHEAGHFVAAKRAGAKVEEFGFGFPPRLFGIRRGDTTYSINLVPFGGFVKIKGESGGESEDPTSFSALSATRRSIILVSGVAMNVVLAVVLLSATLVIGAPTALDGPIPRGATVSGQSVQILQVMSGTPAEIAGLRLGDKIVSIDSKPVQTADMVREYNNSHAGVLERLTIRRGSTTLTVAVMPTVLADSEGKAVWGVNLADVGIITFPWYTALWMGARNAFGLLWQILLAFGAIIGGLVAQGKLTADFAGPIGIAAMTGQVASLGFIYILQFAALLSLNLALVNILPFPSLDGGRLLFLLIETLRRKKASIRVEAMVNNIGFAVLIALVLAITVHDVRRYGSGIMGFFSNLFGG